MRLGLNEEAKLAITKFIKGFSLSVVNKMDLQTFLSLNDACNLAIKIKKQLKK